jgi:hypothetical protein
VTDPSSSFSETTSSTKWTKTSIRAVNLTHVLARLDELDAGSGERMVLMARYEQSCLKKKKPKGTETDGQPSLRCESLHS